MSEITRRDMLKVLGASGVMLGGMSSSITGLDKLIEGEGVGNLKIEMDKSYGADLIKPGTIIDTGNYKNFPQLKDLLPEHQYLRLQKGATRSDLPPINIVPTRELSLTEPERKWAEKNRGVVKLNKDYTLGNWKAGIPFPEPKDMYEVTWNFQERHWSGDSFNFPKASFVILDRNDRKKIIVAWFIQKPLKGRTTVPPVPEYPDNPDNILWKQAVGFTSPYDVAGFGVLRIRYDSLTKADDSWAYVPAIRRVRRYTGADVQDPLFGSDNVMDDFASWMQKIDFKNVFPTEVKEGKILSPAYLKERLDGHTLRIDKRQIYYPGWEIRPVYKLTVAIKDSNYMYSKRITYIDKETYQSHYGEFYDQKGKLFRTWTVGMWWTKEGERSWTMAEIEDWINGSKTWLQLNSNGYNDLLSDKRFTLNDLKDKGSR